MESGILTDDLHGLIAVHLGHHNIHQDDCQVWRGLKRGDGFTSGAGGEYAHATALENAAEGENVAHVVVNDQNSFSDESFIGAVQAIEHALLFARQIGDHAMEEESGFVEQTLGGFHAFDDDATGERMQAHVFVRSRSEERRVGKEWRWRWWA